MLKLKFNMDGLTGDRSALRFVPLKGLFIIPGKMEISCLVFNFPLRSKMLSYNVQNLENDFSIK